VGALEVLLVDNTSTDGSQLRSAREHPGIEILQNTENRGFARAVNQALARAAGEFTLLPNPDAVLSPAAIPVLVAFMSQRPDAAVVGPKLLNADGTVQGSARRDPSFWTGLGDGSWWVRFYAAVALAELGESGHAALQAAVTDPEPTVRDMARYLVERGPLLPALP
jgi:GT2 family glycosyltransferase